MSAASHQEQARGGAGSTGRALVPFVDRPQTAAIGPKNRLAALIAGTALVLGLGAAGTFAARHDIARLLAGRPDTTVATMHRLEDQVAKLQASIDALRVAADGARADEPWRGLKRSVDAVKQDVEQVRAASSSAVAQLAAKIDKADHDPSPKLAEIASRLDRMEHDPGAKAADATGPKLAELAGRLDRLEKQAAAPATTGSIPPAHAAAAAASAKPMAAGPVPPAKADLTQLAPAGPTKMAAAAAPTVSAWILRDVYDGVALVQGRDGGLREIGLGEYLPGAGEVRSIERHGRGWVVLTSRGVIASATN